MNSKGHLIISSIKSAVRILSCILSIRRNSVISLAAGLLVAECLGILEELVDNR